VSRRLHIEIDHGRCVGNAMCVATEPDVFAHNENRQSEAVNPEAGSPGRILLAAESCPTAAITVEDADTGERLFPPGSGS